MSIVSYIPFTQARRQRLMKLGWQNYAAGYDGLAMVEWPDGSKSPRPVNWDDELNALETDDGKRFFVRGRGAEPRQLFGVPVWDVNAEGLGVVSTEAALLSDREHYGEFEEATAGGVDDLEVSGDPTNGSSQQAVADGGEQATGTLYNLNPPRGYDGEGFSVSLPADYAPFPASQTDAEQAVTAAEQAQNDDTQNLTWLLIGVGIALGCVLLFFIIQWLTQELSTGSGGGTTINAVLPLIMAGTTPLRDRIRDGVDRVKEVVA